MKREIFKISDSNKPVIEPVIQDENLHFMHMVLLEGESLRTHYTNANVYMTVVKGTLSISLDESDFEKHDKNTVLKIPFNVKMDVQNHDSDILELFVVKAPAPGKFYTK